MKKKLLMTAVASLFLLSLVLAGCQSSSTDQESYNRVLAQFYAAQEKIEEAYEKIETLEDEKEALSTELADATSRVGELEGLVDSLKMQYELAGDTPAETAQKVVKYYHETHVYDETDMFVCADMAAEVWNMLKAQGINALIAVGNLDTPITEITQSNHSWVLAEVAPGEYLALETTAGVVKPRSENPEYYLGWTFETPAAEKDWQWLAREYNTRLEIFHDIDNEIDKAQIEYDYAIKIFNTMVENESSDIQMEDQRDKIDRWRAIKDKLIEIKESMEEELSNIQDQMEGQATKCSS